MKGAYLTHQLGRLDLSPSSNNLALTNPLRLGSHRKRILQLIAENDILDQHRLNQNTPGSSDIFDNLRSRLSNLLAPFDDILQHASTNHMAQCCLGTLDEGLFDVGDAKGGLVRRGDLVVDDGGQGERDVVFGHADLARDLDDLNLDVNSFEVLTERVDLDETGVHGAFESIIIDQYRVDSSECSALHAQKMRTYRPNLETRPTSPWSIGLKGLGQQKQQGIAPIQPRIEPKP